MAKRHYIPITADVPGVNEGQRAFIRKVIRTALAAEGVDFPCEVDVLLTNDEAIHQINLDMREVDRATDVLSFPEFDLQPGELPGGEDADPGTGLVPLGDMVISTCWAMTIWTKARRKSRCGAGRRPFWRSWGSTGRIEKTQTQMIFKKGEANMSIVIGSMILCVIGTFILMWICSMLMGDDGLYVACFLFVALMFALLVKIYIKQEEIQENQAEILKKLKEIEPKEENKQE